MLWVRLVGVLQHLGGPLRLMPEPRSSSELRCPWVQYPVDLAGQRLKGCFLFGVVGVAVIGAAHAADDVPQTALSVVGVDASAATSANGRCGADHATSSR